MLEVEVKYRDADWDAVRAKLLAWGAAADPLREDADNYFNAPDRDFAQTDEAVRVRRTGEKNVLTYKGPKRDTATKTRTEVEVPLAPGPEAAELAERWLRGAGFRSVAVVRKQRQVYRFRRGGFELEACFDDAGVVGKFVELEIQAEEADYEQAKTALLATAAELGLTEQERRSYLRMNLEKGTQLFSAEKSCVPFSSIADVRAAVAAVRRRGQTIGFVPTMGALHEGHAALIRTAKRATDFVVVSVFVNPTQFGPNEDFHRYPRTLDADRAVSADAGADLIFAPTAAEMYPDASLTYVEVGQLQDELEGPARPGHFRGVCTVVLKLFNIVLPDVAIFGQKDAQQARIIRQMVRDLNVPVRVQIEPTVRESDGLALSSRNRYLSPGDRALAPQIYKAMQAVRESALKGETNTAQLEASLNAALAAIPGARVDYARIVDDDTLRPLATLDRPARAIVAVFLGTTRLIDNVSIP